MLDIASVTVSLEMKHRLHFWEGFVHLTHPQIPVPPGHGIWLLSLSAIFCLFVSEIMHRWHQEGKRSWLPHLPSPPHADKEGMLDDQIFQMNERGKVCSLPSLMAWQCIFNAEADWHQGPFWGKDWEDGGSSKEAVPFSIWLAECTRGWAPGIYPPL